MHVHLFMRQIPKVRFLFPENSSQKRNNIKHEEFLTKNISVLPLSQCMATTEAFEIQQISVPISMNDKESRMCICFTKYNISKQGNTNMQNQAYGTN